MLLVGCTNRSEHPGIYDLADWEAFTEAVNTGSPISTWEDSEGVVRLRRDLNLKRWRNPRPVGVQEAMPFRGTFDGGNYTISGLQLKSDGRHVGLFGVNRGTIRRLKMAENCHLESIGEEGFVGAVCAESSGRVELCESAAVVCGGGCVGGIVGLVYSDRSSTVVPLVARCKNLGKVRSTGAEAGGVVGRSDRAKVVDCHNAGAVRCDGLYAGGVIGLNGGLVRGCKNEASVRGTHYAGGVAGANNPAGRLDEIDNTGQVQAETIGYIVGEDFSQQVVDEDTLREHYHREHNP